MKNYYNHYDTLRNMKIRKHSSFYCLIWIFHCNTSSLRWMRENESSSGNNWAEHSSVWTQYYTSEIISACEADFTTEGKTDGIRKMRTISKAKAVLSYLWKYLWRHLVKMNTFVCGKIINTINHVLLIAFGCKLQGSLCLFKSVLKFLI